MNIQTKSVAEQYLRFCDNPLRGDKIVSDEFDTLRAHPLVEQVAFYSPTVIMIGTGMIVMTDHKPPFDRYEIGEFIIFIERRREGRIWIADYFFGNPGNTRVNSGKVTCLHPHISVWNGEEFPTRELGMSIGRLCISKGEFHILQYIRSGEIHRAVADLIDILHVSGSGHPYIDIEYWPVE